MDIGVLATPLFLFVWNLNTPCHLECLHIAEWIFFFKPPHGQQHASFSGWSRQSRGNLGGLYSKGNFGGQLFSIEVWDRSMPTNRSLVMNGRPGLESVSFLTEDRALSWNVSGLTIATTSFSGALTFYREEREGWRQERKPYVTGGRHWVTWEMKRFQLLGLSVK